MKRPAKSGKVTQGNKDINKYSYDEYNAAADPHLRRYIDRKRFVRKS